MPTSPPLPAWLIAALERRALRLDADQMAAAARLDALLTGALPEDVIGAYCYGPPGRGKSLLAALFHEAYPGARVRTHFHAFLRDVNRRLVAAPPSDDKLGEVLAQWLGDSQLLWFDEFHVHDIADALILAALLRVAIARRVHLLFTSNQAPRGAAARSRIPSSLRADHRRAPGALPDAALRGCRRLSAHRARAWPPGRACR